MKERAEVRRLRLALQEAAAEIECVTHRLRRLEQMVKSDAGRFELGEGITHSICAAADLRLAAEREVEWYDETQGITCFACHEGVLGYHGCDNCKAKVVA